ncbi:unnamed protein product, partial [Staurois parvus]
VSGCSQSHHCVLSLTDRKDPCGSRRVRSDVFLWALTFDA